MIVLIVLGIYILGAIAAGWLMLMAEDSLPLSILVGVCWPIFLILGFVDWIRDR